MTEADICKGCRRCLKGKLDDAGWPLILSTMTVCPECGNKRCPKATDHNNACTGSNEPGQPESDYK